MSNLRNQKLSKQIQKDLSEIIGNIARNNYKGVLISVSEVRLTADLSIAKVFLSIFPSENAETIVAELETVNKPIRFELGNRLKNQVRKIPELRFIIDNSFDELSKIDKLLNKN